MRVYIEIARMALRQNVAYRTATLAGLFTNSVFGVILSSVMIGFYASLDERSVRGWSEADSVTLIWINQSLIMVMYLWGWWDVSKSRSPAAQCWCGKPAQGVARHRRSAHHPWAARNSHLWPW